MNRYLLPLVLFLSSVGLFAQEDIPKINATFYTFRFAPDHRSVYIRIGEAEYQKIQLSTANLIGPKKVVALGNKVTLHTVATAEDGTEIYPTIATAKIAGGMSSALIMLQPGDGEDLGKTYQTLVLDNRTAKFPRGSYKLVNMSPYPIRGMIGEKTKFGCKAGAVSNFKTSGSPGEVMPVLIQYNDGKKWRNMTETRWSHSDRKRSLLCAYRDQATNRMKLRSIPDNSQRGN